MISYKSIGWILVVAIVGIHAFFLWNVRDRIVRADPDFTSFYGAGKIVRDGWGAQLYDFQTQQKTQAQSRRRDSHPTAAGGGGKPYRFP